MAEPERTFETEAAAIFLCLVSFGLYDLEVERMTAAAEGRGIGD